MADLIYSVNEIFTSYLKDQKYFNIPDYQRGYKWDAKDVEKLLDDLKKFEDSNRTPDSFYCLQNITLVPSKEKDILNVVDGQQRLTTLFILLSYYKNNKDGKNDFNPEILKYSIREKTAATLTDLYDLDGSKNMWGNLSPTNAEHRDEYYILTVANKIREWFEENDLAFETVWNKVKLIVNKIDGKTEETIFANINGGKVTLDGADLVRAVLMTRSAKEKTPNSAQKTNEFRVRMGMEIDTINYWWSNSDVKKYYQQLLPNALEEDSTFNQVEYPISLLYKLFYEINKNNPKLKNKHENFSFDFFEYGTDFDEKTDNNFYEMYKEILSLHYTLKDWYNHQQIYHLLGYLFFNFKGNNINLDTIWNEIWQNTKKKSEFVDELKKLISNELEKFVEEGSSTDEEKRKNLLGRISNINEDWYDSDATLKILPLMDVIHFASEEDTSKKKKGRLPVSYFKSYSEDKEHIMCQNPRENDESIRRKDAVDFLENFFKDSDVKTLEEYKKLMDKIKKGKEEFQDDDVLSDEEKQKFESFLHSYSLNSLGNIVLLDGAVNKSYGNAPHNEKVSRLVSEYFGNQHYIRPFTISVFLEKDSKEVKKEWHWGIKEITENAKNISNQIFSFLNWNEKE